MNKPVTTINGIDIFEIEEYHYPYSKGTKTYMLKKGFCTVGVYYTLEQAKKAAKNK